MKKNMRGFTMVELVIVIAITMIITLVALSTQGSFLVNTNLENNTTQIVETLRSAETRAESGFHDDSWGVFFSGDAFVLFKGTDYATRDTSFDIETTLPSSISISGINLNGGGNSVVFNKLTGETSQYGSLIVADNSNNTHEITINSKGTISY